ncbi:MAG: hemerythrin domain-containing protein [Polyangiales bacterium]
MDGPDPLLALEHDHVHLSRIVADLRDMVPASHPELVPTLLALRDDLFHHFAREEEALFPYLVQTLPDLKPAIAVLESAHDRVCGAVSRLCALADKGPSPLIAQLFERLDAEYLDHARKESEFLRGLAGRLSKEQRAHVRALIQDV